MVKKILLYSLLSLFISFSLFIICPCKVDPLTPHFYIVKLGYTGEQNFFLILLLNIDCGYSSSLGWFYRVPTIYVLSKNKKKSNFLFMNYHFYTRWKLQYIAWACYHNTQARTPFLAPQIEYSEFLPFSTKLIFLACIR